MFKSIGTILINIEVREKICYVKTHILKKKHLDFDMKFLKK